MPKCRRSNGVREVLDVGIQNCLVSSDQTGKVSFVRQLRRRDTQLSFLPKFREASHPLGSAPATAPTLAPHSTLNGMVASEIYERHVFPVIRLLNP